MRSDFMEQKSHLPSDDVEEPSVIISPVLAKIQDAVAMAILKARQRLLQGFTVFSIVLLLLSVAAFLYGSFYYSYMPRAAFSTPVHYYYRTDCESPSSFLCSHPVSNVSLMRDKKHALTFGQMYRIYLQLEMPDSPTNQQVGMFMIKTACFSQDGEQVATSARSASQLQKASSSRIGMLRYQSDLLKTLGTLLFLPMFLSGAAEQKQVLEVELFSEYTDDPYSPSVTAVIEIMSSTIQIYSSQLYIHAHFTGIRYLLFHFPVLSAIAGVLSNFIFLSFLFILSYTRQLFKAEQTPEQVMTDDHLELEENRNNKLQDGNAAAADPAELLGPLQTDPTDLSQEESHLQSGNTTEPQNRNMHVQDGTNDSEASGEGQE